MSDESGKNTLGDLIITYSGLVLVAISLVTFLYLVPSSINQISKIIQLGAEITEIPGFGFNSTFIYGSLIATIILVVAGLSTFVYHNDRISVGFRRQKSSAFFGYLMIYILVQLILSEIFAYVVPNFGTQFPFGQTSGVQNFIFSYLTLEETVLYQLIPITVFVGIISAMYGKLSLKSFTFYNFNGIQIVIIALFVAFIATLFIPGTPFVYISDFISLFVLNIIFLKFGFLKALLANFSEGMINVTASLVSGSFAASILLPVFLFFLGFLGVYILVQISMDSTRTGSISRATTAVERDQERRSRIPTIEPFIHSRCPDCGNAMYHILLPTKSMKCTKCGLELEKDAMGDDNIKIELRGSPRYNN